MSPPREVEICFCSCTGVGIHHGCHRRSTSISPYINNNKFGYFRGIRGVSFWKSLSGVFERILKWLCGFVVVEGLGPPSESPNADRWQHSSQSRLREWPTMIHVMPLNLAVVRDSHYCRYLLVFAWQEKWKAKRTHKVSQPLEPKRITSSNHPTSKQEILW